jgi:hypothetical protein
MNRKIGARAELGARSTTPSSRSSGAWDAINRLQLPAAAAQIVELGARTDAYVGCAPRRRRPGGHGALGSVWALWVDCDTPGAVAALGRFSPAPAIVIRSGSAENRHAYWTLQSPSSADEATLANRRLAHALGADGGAVTTILRPPGTLNFKHRPATPVIAECLRPWRRVSARALVGELADQPVRKTSRPARPRGWCGQRR